MGKPAWANHQEKKQNLNSERIQSRLQEVIDLVKPYVTKAYIRESKKGVPHVVIGTNDNSFSVTYFLKTRTFRVFHPYPSFDREQTKRDFKQPREIAALFQI